MPVGVPPGVAARIAAAVEARAFDYAVSALYPITTPPPSLHFASVSGCVPRARFRT